MDDDLDSMSRDELLIEIKKLRGIIREHRDGGGQDLCWHHPSLWEALPEKSDPLPPLPDWPDFIRGCVNYRQSQDAQLRNKRKTDIPDKKQNRSESIHSPKDLLIAAALKTKSKRQR